MPNRVIIALATIILFASTANADFLYERAGGAAYYDWEQNITWLTDANYPRTSGTDAQGSPDDGFMGVASATTWMDNFNASEHLGVNTWRLPRLIDLDNDGSVWRPCNGSLKDNLGEMAFLFYDILDLKFWYDCSTPREVFGLAEYSGPFINVSDVESAGYWYGQSYIPDPNLQWVFHFHYGGQHADGNGGGGVVWPVFDGDLLFAAGDELPTQINVDVKPWHAVNIIDPDEDVRIPFALFGSPTFDAAQADLSTMHVGPDRLMPVVGTTWVGDLNGDSIDDLSAYVETQGTGIACDDTDLMLLGETFSGETFVGSDVISTPDCPSAGCHP
jgi:hypothetical protein